MQYGSELPIERQFTTPTEWFCGLDWMVDRIRERNYHGSRRRCEVVGSMQLVWEMSVNSHGYKLEEVPR